MGDFSPKPGSAATHLPKKPKNASRSECEKEDGNKRLRRVTRTENKEENNNKRKEKRKKINSVGGGNKVKKSEIIWSRGGPGHYQRQATGLIHPSFWERGMVQEQGWWCTSSSRASSSGEARPREMEKLKPPEIG